MTLDVYHASRPIIRLLDFDREDLHALQNCVQDLSNDRRRVVALHEEPYVKPLGGCRFTLRLGRADRGIEHAVEPNLFGWTCEPGAWDPFICELTPTTWAEVATGIDLLLQLRFLCSEYVWLHKQWHGHGEVAWLLSPDGDW